MFSPHGYLLSFNLSFVFLFARRDSTGSDMSFIFDWIFSSFSNVLQFLGKYWPEPITVHSLHDIFNLEQFETFFVQSCIWTWS